MSRRGALAIVLHTHMPYVEGFGVWPFGEEWLWEAVATSYVPLLERVLGRVALTLSLTPVLCDQLEAPGVVGRCVRFLREVRPESHARDIAELEAAGERALADALRISAAEYAAAADVVEARGEGLLAALGDHAAWTSSATHAVLPLLATEAGARLQVETGIDAHRRRFGGWRGGFWLPECGYAPWLDPLLASAGVRHVCVELTNALGWDDPRHLRPLLTDTGIVLWPIDRSLIHPVWGEGGYPSRPEYRHHSRYTTHRHRAWSYGGGPYDPAAAARAVVRDAEEFVALATRRVTDGGLAVCALDTELLGHWWHEGVDWLAAVIDAAAVAGLRLVSLDDALTDCDPLPAGAHGELGVTSWGAGGDLRTWSGPRVADLAFRARAAELRTLAALRGDGAGPLPSPRALRELLALQSSDWAFLVDRDTAGPYPRERFEGHLAELAAALAAARTGSSSADGALRDLAPDLAWG